MIEEDPEMQLFLRKYREAMMAVDRSELYIMLYII
jgi:hypothetical protein